MILTSLSVIVAVPWQGEQFLAIVWDRCPPSTVKYLQICCSYIKLNPWLSAPKGATPLNWTSATDWQMAVRRDVISITLHQV